MIALTQENVGGPDAPVHERGDCFRTCICSVLELPVSALDSQDPELPYDEWEACWTEQLVRIGLWMLRLAVDDGDEWWLPPEDTYWVASVPSLNLGTYDDGRPIPHAVVMRGRKLAHDPSRGKRYEYVSMAEVSGATFLIPTDPARPANEVKEEKESRAVGSMKKGKG